MISVIMSSFANSYIKARLELDMSQTGTEPEPYLNQTWARPATDLSQT